MNNTETPTKENSFLDVTKLSEKEREEVEEITGIIIYRDCFYIHFHSVKKRWFAFTEFKNEERKKEINFQQFKEMMGSEGKAEAENDGWIKIESEKDLPKEQGTLHWTIIDGEISMYNYNHNTMDLWKQITHYQPIIKPLPPKF